MCLGDLMWRIFQKRFFRSQQWKVWPKLPVRQRSANRALNSWSLNVRPPIHIAIAPPFHRLLPKKKSQKLIRTFCRFSVNNAWSNVRYLSCRFTQSCWQFFFGQMNCHTGCFNAAHSRNPWRISCENWVRMQIMGKLVMYSSNNKKIVAFLW